MLHLESALGKYCCWNRYKLVGIEVSYHDRSYSTRNSSSAVRDLRHLRQSCNAKLICQQEKQERWKGWWSSTRSKSELMSRTLRAFKVKHYSHSCNSSSSSNRYRVCRRDIWELKQSSSAMPHPENWMRTRKTILVQTGEKWNLVGKCHIGGQNILSTTNLSIDN